MSEEVGKHKGAVETLLHEKKELSRLLQIVNSQLERHLGALEEKGVDTDQFINQVQNQQQRQQQQREKQKKQKRTGNNQQGGQRNRNQQNNQKKQRKNQPANQKNNDSKKEESEDGQNDRDFSPL